MLGDESRNDSADIGRVEDVLDREQGTRLQLDAARPALAHLGEDRPGDAGLRADESRWVRISAGAVGIGAAQGEIHAAARRPRPTSCASRSSATASSAPTKVPSGFGCAARYGPCRDGCACRRRPGRTMPPSRSTAGELSRAGRREALDAAVRRWRCRRAKPSASAPARTPSTRHGRQRRVGRARSAARRRSAARPVSSSVLPPQGALVPLPQEEMRERLVRKKISDAGAAREGPAPRRGAGC